MKKVAITALLFTAVAMFAQSGHVTQPKPEAGAASVAASAPALTSADIEAFLDGIVPLQISRDNIAGAVVAVVKDGKVIFEKGYGYADVNSHKPVSATDTLFRPGSISKLFTWTAVMQQVEQGKLDLDRDVNDYLDFKIPATYPQPITLRNIMTHTSGFEEVVKDLFVDDTSHLQPLGTYLSTHMPRRLFPPGTSPAYSNYATALAGYIVQRVSGEPFNQYIDNHIFKPLAMAHCTFDQPLPANLQPLMSTGYRVASGPASKFELVQAWPAGSSSVSADDMTHFILAHLQDGQYNGAQILRPETAKLMHSRQFGLSPDMNAMALGFYEETRNGHRIIGHGGDTQAFHSDLHIVPDLGLGFFVSYNSAGRQQANNRSELWHAVLDRYYPYTPAAKTTASAGDARSVAGTYLVSRRSDGSVIRMAGILGETTVAPGPDGTVIVSSMKGPNGQEKKWVEIAPLEYREANGQDRIAFRRSGDGKTDLVIDYPFMFYQRVPWYQGLGLFRLLFFCALTMFVVTIIAWPVAAGVRKHYGTQLALSPLDRTLRRAVRIVCVLDIVVLCLWLYLLTAASASIGMLSHRFDMRLHLLLTVGFIASAATLIALYNAYRAMRDPERWKWAKLWEVLLACACLAYSWILITLNLAGFSAQY